MPFDPLNPCRFIPANVGDDLFRNYSIQLLCGILDTLIGGGGGPAASVNISAYGGTPTAIGQALMAASMPVVIASNQSAIAVTTTPSGTQDVNLTQVSGAAVTLGQALMAAGIPVTLASNQSSIPVAATQTTSPWVVSGTATVSGTVTVEQPTGTNLHTVIDSGTITTVTGVTTVSTVTTVTGVTAITGSVTPGVAAGNLGKAEDAAATSGDTGVFVLGVRRDTPASSSADGDYTEMAVNNVNAQYVETANQVATYAANSVAGAAGAIPTTGVVILTDATKKKIISIYNTLDVACLISLDAGASYPFYVPATTGSLNICLGCNGRWTASNIFAKAIGSNSASGTIYVGSVT